MSDRGEHLAASSVPLGGGDPCNTPPQTSHEGGGTIAWTGGEDWLEWSMGVDWGPRWDETRRRLNTAREAAATATNAMEDQDSIISFGSRMIGLYPGGGRLGKGSKGPYMAWRFKGEGMTFLMADRPEAHKNLPSVHVRADGMACLQVGAYELWRRARDLIAMMGGEIAWERLSRVDLCLDMPGQIIAPFRAAFEENRYVTRAKGKGYREGPGLTLYIGSAPPLLRIYDKLNEVMRGNDGGKQSLMAYHRWGGVQPDAATRVEFELTRDALRRRGIDSVQDYYNRRGDLADYLCRDWVRFTTIKPDRTHTTRAPTLPLWDRVHAGFMAWTGEPAGIELKPMPREACEVSQLIKCIVGTGLTAIARQGIDAPGEASVAAYLTRNVLQELARIDWRTRLQHKRMAFPSED
jgi:hypothetical protein